MKTASFATYFGPGRIGISVGRPRRDLTGYCWCPSLAPTRAMLHLDEPTYREKYFRDILGALDAARVWDELHALAGDAEPVLLCYERPPFTAENWCHRRMVAEWFAHRLGQDVPELVRPPRPTVQSDLFAR